MSERFDLLYGDPGSAKTRTLIKFIQSEIARTGKGARVYVGDGSGTMYRNSGLIGNGLELMDWGMRKWPFAVLQDITEGKWPVDDDDPESKLIPLTPKQVQDTGVWIFEGAAVAGQYMMGPMEGGLANRAAKGERIGQEADIRFADDSDHQYAGNSAAHYNVAQTHILNDILRTKRFPGSVFWTTHERYDDGERGGSVAKGQTGVKQTLNEKIVGPEVVGKALTNSISRQFGNTLHCVVASKKVQGKTLDPTNGKPGYEETTSYRIYTRDHYDPDGITAMKYRAVVRAMHPDKIDLYYESPANDPGIGLIKLYTALAAAV